MGAEIVTAIVEQKGAISVNSENLVPSTSRPILQIDATPAFNFQPIQQVTGFKTNDATSTPIEQRVGASFNLGSTSPDDTFLEQIRPERDVVGAKPLEQLIFVTSNLRASPPATSRVIEQRKLSRNSDTESTLEQKEQITNSITLDQYEFAELIFPPCNSVKNPITSNILWRIRDFGSPFDIGTLLFSVNGVQVEDAPTFVVTAIANGLQLDYDPPEPFDFDSQVNIVLDISDSADPPNNFLYHCSWRTVQDSVAPTIELISPQCNSVDVGVKDAVIFDVLDVGEGVDQDSIRLYIEGIPVCEGLSFSPLTTVSGSGFRGTWTHTTDPFRFDSTVSVSIEATDLSPLENTALFICCFQIISSAVPEFMNFDPFPCETFVDNKTGLSFEVYGDVDGIDITTLEVRIDNKLRTVLVRPRILRSE